MTKKYEYLSFPHHSKVAKSPAFPGEFNQTWERGAFSIFPFQQWQYMTEVWMVGVHIWNIWHINRSTDLKLQLLCIFSAFDMELILLTILHQNMNPPSSTYVYYTLCSHFPVLPQKGYKIYMTASQYKPSYNCRKWMKVKVKRSSRCLNNFDASSFPMSHLNRLHPFFRGVNWVGTFLIGLVPACSEVLYIVGKLWVFPF